MKKEKEEKEIVIKNEVKENKTGLKQIFTPQLNIAYLKEIERVGLTLEKHLSNPAVLNGIINRIIRPHLVASLEKETKNV